MSCSCTSSLNPAVPAASPTVESICRESLHDCRSQCFEDNRNCPGGCSGEPLAMAEPAVGAQMTLERCCDANGCCGLYPVCCRNPFWPHFAHPSWLCCRDLYRQ